MSSRGAQRRKEREAAAKDTNGLTPVGERRNKVAIVGFTAHRAQAPFTDPEFEIWGMNALILAWPQMPRWNRWFDVHMDDALNPRQQQALAWYKAQDGTRPIYLQRAKEDVPGSVAFPRDAVIELGRDYFTNSVSWMVALAILEGFEEIHVYGIDMASDTEYAEQRPNLEYWAGVAEGRGIKFIVPTVCDLLKAAHQYGFQDDGGMRTAMLARKADMEKKVAALENNIQQMNLNLANVMGALEAVNWALRTWTVASDARRREAGEEPLHPLQAGGAKDEVVYATLEEAEQHNEAVEEIGKLGTTVDEAVEAIGTAVKIIDDVGVSAEAQV